MDCTSWSNEYKERKRNTNTKGKKKRKERKGEKNRTEKKRKEGYRKDEDRGKWIEIKD